MFNLPQKSLPIAVLIRDRCRDLDITPTELIRRSGYKNVSKGFRRLERLCDCYVSGCEHLIRVLPVALEVSDQELNHAIEESQRQLRDAEEAAWRAAFEPHAVILTERRVPQPIFLVAIIGVNDLLRVDFDLQAGPLTFASQAHAALQNIRGRNGMGTVIAFGRPIGFMVNYSPDHAIEFDLDGNPVVVFDHAHRLGYASYSISGRVLTDDELAAVFGRIK